MLAYLTDSKRKHHRVDMQINKLLQPKNNLGRGDQNCLSRGDPKSLGRDDPNCLGRGHSNCLGRGNPNYLTQNIWHLRTKSRKTKSRIGQNPERTKSRMDKIQNLTNFKNRESQV